MKTVSPRSGVTALALQRMVVRQATNYALALRPSRTAHRFSDLDSRPGCPPDLPVTGGILWLSLDPPEALKLLWTVGDCRAASVVVKWDRRTPSASVRAGLSGLSDELKGRASARPGPVLSVEPEARAPIHGLDEDAAADRARSLRALERADPVLARAVRARIGLRYRKGADGSEGFIGGPEFVRGVYLDAYSIDLGRGIKKHLESGESLAFDKRHPGRSLRPGDLLFFMSYGGIPRSVMVYVGSGCMARAMAIRGVVVDKVPAKIADYVYLIAIRPDEATVRGIGRY